MDDITDDIGSEEVNALVTAHKDSGSMTQQLIGGYEQNDNDDIEYNGDFKIPVTIIMRTYTYYFRRIL